MNTAMVWVQELKEENGDYKLVGSALPIKPMPENIGFLKKLIIDYEKLTVGVSRLRIFFRTEGQWQEEKKMSNGLRPLTEEEPYGYVVP